MFWWASLPHAVFQNSEELRKSPGLVPQNHPSPSHGFSFWQNPCPTTHNGWNRKSATAPGPLFNWPSRKQEHSSTHITFKKNN